MAEADSRYTSPSSVDEWTLDEAFQYLTQVVGLESNLAIGRLNEGLLNGRPLVRCQHFIKGKLIEQEDVRPDFWRDHLTLMLKDGHAHVRVLKGLEPGDYRYLLSPQIVQMLWPSNPNEKQSRPVQRQPNARRRHGAPGAKPKFDWDAMHTQCLRRIDDDGRPSNISEFTRGLLDWYQSQFPEGPTPDFDTARPYVVKWIAAWERSLPKN
jgi:hypothetical protein